MSQIFLLSPANCNGRRATQALSPNASFALAAALRSPDGAPLGELFSFVSGLYFRGKLTRGDVDAANVRSRRPLEASARALLAEIGPDCDVVLLGSVASPKYVDVLTGIFGARLQFPSAFVGRGDMSRGGLMLRHASEGVELHYVPVLGTVLHGSRPAKLPPLPRIAGLQKGRMAGSRT